MTRAALFAVAIPVLLGAAPVVRGLSSPPPDEWPDVALLSRMNEICARALTARH